MDSVSSHKANDKCEYDFNTNISELLRFPV